MKKKILFYTLGLITLTLFSCNDEATVEENQVNYLEKNDVVDNPLTAEQAADNALSYLYGLSTAATKSFVDYEVQDIVPYTVRDNDSFYKNSTRNSDVVFYAVNLKDNKGFVLASANERYVPVFGYVERGRFNKEDRMCPGFKSFIDNLANRIATQNDTVLWKPVVTKSVTATSAGPYLTTNWGPGYPYNTYSLNTYCTPMAVALAQIAAYCMNPKTLYYEQGDSTISFTFNWSNILYESSSNSGQLVSNTTAAYQVSHLMNRIEKPYAVETRTASYNCLFLMFYLFGYNGFGLTAFTNINAESEICSSLNGYKLIYARGGSEINNYSGQEYNNHAWVIDGYNNSTGSCYFHCNWGWDGDYNGNFLSSGFEPITSLHYQYALAYWPEYNFSE